MVTYLNLQTNMIATQTSHKTLKTIQTNGILHTYHLGGGANSSPPKFVLQLNWVPLDYIMVSNYKLEIKMAITRTTKLNMLFVVTNSNGLAQYQFKTGV
jgi:hypothetical protein